MNAADAPSCDVQRAARRRTAMVCASAAAAMLALAFASKPLYDTFCRVTGFGGETRVADVAPPVLGERMVTVRFDANIERGLPLRFEASEPTRTLRVGENALTFYSVTNTSDQPLRAVASYNVAPFKAGPFFAKIECFCFQDQMFAPGETREMPVVFFVDPAMDDERRMDDVRQITLSYTFFEAAEGEDTVGALLAAAARS